MFNLIPWRKRKEVARDGGFWPSEQLQPLARMRQEFNNLFERLWSGSPALWESFLDRSWFWDLDVEDRPDEYVVRVEAPGFESGDFDVRLSGNVLTIRAERSHQRRNRGATSYRYGSLRRMVTVPRGIEPDKIEARYRNGILEVRLPKGEGARGKRIPVHP